MNGATLKSVLELLAGDHPRSSELDPEYANSVRIQLDVKEDGIIDELFQLIDELQFPYSRIGLAGNNSYAHVGENIEKIRARVDQGMDFWMNPNYILSYEAMANDTDAFIENIKALGLSRFTVNSDYRHMTEQILKSGTLVSSLTSSDLHETGSGTTSER